MKAKVVLSGVNFTEMGPLAVFTEALQSLVALHSDRFDVIALVHRKAILLDVPGVTFLEFPMIKSSWWKRLRFEYFDCLSLSKQIKPFCWFAMHDMTPNVQAQIRVVYCHNPAPFYPFSAKQALLDWKFGMFSLLYGLLYRINLKKNDFVVVQQDWLRDQFKSRYGATNVVVAHPSIRVLPVSTTPTPEVSTAYRFFYPAYPRTFKNIEQVLEASLILERGGANDFEVWLTMDGTETPYAAMLRAKYASLKTVRWLGLQPRSRVMSLYQEADCLLFPSMLETWGLPITEFKPTGRPILAAELPYARETIGDYEQAAFFVVGDNQMLATRMQEAITGKPVFGPVFARTVAPPYSRNWEELWKLILPEQGDSKPS